MKRELEQRSGSAASDRLLSTMAVVVADADEGKDYLASFVPFVADRLKAWPAGEAVEPHELSRALCDGWGFPSMPAAVSRVLLERAQSERLVRNVNRRFYPNPERLRAIPDLSEKKQRTLSELDALAKAVIAYAWEVRALDWNEERAYAGLERLTEDFGAELATARRDGGLDPARKPAGDDPLPVVHGFASRAIARDPTNFNRLVTMVQGAMIANALYFEDTRKLPNRLPNLRAYVDTAPLLRGLGLASPGLVTAAQEMLALMRAFQIPMFAFEHTLDELTAILEAVARSLKRGTRGVEQQGRLSERSRETVVAAIQAGMTSGDMLALIANLEQRLAELGVRPCETPKHTEAHQIDEERLAKVLKDRIQYSSTGSLRKDVESLAAVDRLRGSTRPRELARTKAIFVTSNTTLAKASRSFFRSAGRDAPIPHCMSDTALTAQLWVTSSARKPDLPRHLLIADCYSALAPSRAVWERWVSHIVHLRKQERLTEAQVQTLIYHQQIKTLLFEIARGNPDNINDTAVARIIERHEVEVRGPAERAAEQAADEARAAQREREQALRQVEILTRWKEQQQAKEERCARRLYLARRRGGFLAMVERSPLLLTGQAAVFCSASCASSQV